MGTAGTLPGAFTCEGGHFTLSAWLEPAATVGGNPFDYTMKFSLYIPTGTPQEFSGYTDPIAAFEKIRELAMAADDGGFETIWAPDHFVTFGPPGAYVFEVWTTLAALARETRAIKLGQLVTGNGYRNPTLLAKMASTLDVISHGRLTFGVGAGWYEDEYRSFGYEFASGPERLRQLEEALHIITSMWTEPSTSFDGKYYRAQNVVNQPAGVQTPHIPVMIAGGGEKVTLKLVAKYGDLCNVQEPPAEVARKYGVLAEHCANLGRDYATITKTATSYCIIADTDEAAQAAVPPWAPMVFPGSLGDYGLVGTLDTIRERIAGYEQAGVDELIVGFQDALDADTLRAFGSEFIHA